MDSIAGMTAILELDKLRAENERLRAAAANVVEAWTREDDSIAEAIVTLGQTLISLRHN